ncbi:MAG: hypothetical protein MZW92_42450 [Comamonadaceae bacterium]|nr:hypothetical protein [Comamonadaceae bacterium]
MRKANVRCFIGAMPPDQFRDAIDPTGEAHGQVELDRTHDFDFTLIENASLLAFALVFLGGILTSIGPCNVAMIPLVVGYVGGSRDLPRSRAFILSLTFAIGLALTFMLLGVAAALIGGLIGASTTWWYYLVAFVCFVIGLEYARHPSHRDAALAGRTARDESRSKVCLARWRWVWSLGWWLRSAPRLCLPPF